MNAVKPLGSLATTGRAPVATQATAIEQQRAVAQVQAAIVVAKQQPRDELAAASRVEAACQVQALAERAFFRYKRGGESISGPSIHLATELARCWGNIDYGIAELARDDIGGKSEMLAYAWDLETNARNATTFIVPHKRDKREGPGAIVEMRDIYENNANMGARRLRECIFHVLPKSLIEEAKNRCIQTLEHGGGKPIEARRADLLAAFAALGVTRKQVETKIGRAADKLTAFDIGVLGVVYQSIRRGEITAAEEFPDDRAADMQASLKTTGNGAKPDGAAGLGDTQAGSTTPAADVAPESELESAVIRAISTLATSKACATFWATDPAVQQLKAEDPEGFKRAHLRLMERQKTLAGRGQ